MVARPLEGRLIQHRKIQLTATYEWLHHTFKENTVLNCTASDIYYAL